MGVMFATVLVWTITVHSAMILDRECAGVCIWEELMPTAAHNHRPKNERLDLRIASDLKEEIEQAAAISGVPVSAFVLGATLKHAREVIQATQQITLSNRDRDRFLAAIDREDAGPNPALLRTAERFKAATR